MNKIRIVVVDDEKLAREGISLLLSRDIEVNVIKECGDGKEALQAIIDLLPDIVFLDVQMPLMNGFEVIKGLHSTPVPFIIFVTAYDKHALDAFDINAVDYLLKPFTDERFFKALERGKSEFRKTNAVNQQEKLGLLLDYVQQQQSASQLPYLKRLMVKEGGRIIFLQVEEIRWIESSDYYVILHLADKTYLIRETMASMEEKLDPDHFVRIHRSSIVNINRIKEIQLYGKEDYQVIMLDGNNLKMSRNWFKKLENKLGGKYT